jgi:biotin carboxylase
MPGRILFIAETTSYRADAFVDAGRKLDLDIVLATDRCHKLDEAWEWPKDSLVIDFYEPEASLATLLAEARRVPDRPIVAVIPAGGERAALLGAKTASALGLPYNSVDSAAAAANKLRMRELCARADVAQPRFLSASTSEASESLAQRIDAELGWPVVIKPLFLSGSRGVMRVDHRHALAGAVRRLCRLLQKPELSELDPAAARQILVEAFVPGPEVALEGVLSSGILRTLALFDKPDPLDGPFFEETLYVTPSRLEAELQAQLHATTARAAAAMGLSEGPVHAELRLSPQGPVVIEVAARSIGGLCSRMLRFGTGLSLEEVLVRHALGMDIAGLSRDDSASGVMMIPIPQAGVLKAVGGLKEARAVPGVDEVVISEALERELVPLPEGASYLGFLFARGPTPAEVEATLRQAHRCLRFSIVPTLPVT